MVFVAVGAAVVGTVVSASVSSSASNKAANAARDASAANNSLAASTYAKNTGYLSPAIDRGNAAGGYVNDLLGVGGDPAAAAKAFGQYQNSTGYQFQLNQGLGAINSNAYAKGLGDSGATLKALQQRGNDLGAQSFNNYIGNLGDISRQGTTAASSLAGVGTNMVSQVSSNNNNAAGAIGNAAISNANNINGSIQNLINAGSYAYGSSYAKPSGAAFANQFGTGGTAYRGG